MFLLGAPHVNSSKAFRRYTMVLLGVLVSQPILVVRSRQTYQFASNEHSRCNGGVGYCIGWISAASIFGPTAAVAMVTSSSLLFFFDLAS